MNRSTLTPVLESDRISSIDLLRGVAVLGILIMNIQHFSMPTAAYINPSAYGDLSGLNRLVGFNKYDTLGVNWYKTKNRKCRKG